MRCSHLNRALSVNWGNIMNNPENRSDFSRFLVHLTRNSNGCSAKSNLINIIKDKTIEARNHHCLFSPKLKNMDVSDRLIKSFKTVCFTETPLDQLEKLTSDEFKRQKRLKPYGLVFWRHAMLKHGANPAIYLNGKGTGLREYLLQEFDNHFDGVKTVTKLKRHNDNYQDILHYYSLVNVMNESHDFSWEREWRYSGDFQFKFHELVAIIAEDPEGFLEDCRNELGLRKSKVLNRIPIIAPHWSYEEVVEEMAIKIWQKDT